MKHFYQEVTTLEPDRTAAAAGQATIASFLAAADRLWDKVSAALKVVGLTYPKYDVLTQLRKANGSLPLRVLADGKGCAASNITQIVDRLEADGLVRRFHDPDDRRSVRAELTPEGGKLAWAGEAQIDLIRAEYAESFTMDERAELARLLAKI